MLISHVSTFSLTRLGCLGSSCAYAKADGMSTFYVNPYAAAYGLFIKKIYYPVNPYAAAYGLFIKKIYYPVNPYAAAYGLFFKKICFPVSICQSVYVVDILCQPIRKSVWVVRMFIFVKFPLCYSVKLPKIFSNSSNVTRNKLA